MSGWGRGSGAPLQGKITYTNNKKQSNKAKEGDQLKKNEVPSHHPVEIKGLVYIPNFITQQEEEHLVKCIDSNEWVLDLKRRVQHYGYKFDYTTHAIGGKLGELPEYCNNVVEQIVQNKYFPYVPDQLIINEYQRGQGIGPHSDERCFDTHIASLSLLSPVVMHFRNRKTFEKSAIVLEPRSLLILSGEARYDWTHGIERLDYEIFEGKRIERERRISLTFRRVLQESLH